MATKLTWGLKDAAGSVGFAGCTVEGDVVQTTTQAFAEVIESFSDGGLVHVETSATTYLSNSSTGAESHRNRGVVMLRHNPSGRKWAISIPAVKESNTEKQRGTRDKLLAVVEEAIRDGFVTLSGLADADIVVTESYVVKSSEK